MNGEHTHLNDKECPRCKSRLFLRNVGENHCDCGLAWSYQSPVRDFGFTETETKTIKIPVLMGSDGNWVADSTASRIELMLFLDVEYKPLEKAFYNVEVTLPIPSGEPVTIAGALSTDEQES